MAADLKLLQDYLHAIEKEMAAGNATEHTHRPVLKTLIEGLAEGITATNEPQHITAVGAPDFVINKGAFFGYRASFFRGGEPSRVEESPRPYFCASCNNKLLFMGERSANMQFST